MNFKTIDEYRIYQPGIPFTRRQRAINKFKRLLARIVEGIVLVGFANFAFAGGLASLYTITNLGWIHI